MGYFPKKDSFTKAYQKATLAVGSATKFTGDSIGKGYVNIHTKLSGVSIPFLSSPELLDWSEKITKGTASIYDKALDMEYLKTHIGGGTHRMFDGGHDLISAWDKVKDASPDDSLQHEVIEYVSAVWKDVTTHMGLPIATLDKVDYDSMADWVTTNIPFIDKEYIYDLLSYDVFEVIGSAVGAVAVIFALNKGDQKKLAEILGSMGITTIASANPIMAIVIVLLAGYAYYIKKHKLEKEALAKGAAIASVSVLIFTLLGLPLLIELGIAIVVTTLVRKKIFDNEELQILIKIRIAEMSETTKQSAIQYKKNILVLNDKLVIGLREKSSFVLTRIPFKKQPI